MSLLDAFIQESAPFNVWLAIREDGIAGSGTAADPYNGSPRYGSPVFAALTRGTSSPYDFEAVADTGSVAHHLQNGDLVVVSGATSNPSSWNGLFLVYGVTTYSFKYYMKGVSPHN